MNTIDPQKINQHLFQKYWDIFFPILDWVDDKNPDLMNPVQYDNLTMLCDMCAERDSCAEHDAGWRALCSKIMQLRKSLGITDARLAEKIGKESEETPEWFNAGKK